MGLFEKIEKKIKEGGQKDVVTMKTVEKGDKDKREGFVELVKRAVRGDKSFN